MIRKIAMAALALSVLTSPMAFASDDEGDVDAFAQAQITEQLQAQRNAFSKQIGQLKGKGEDASAVMALPIRCSPRP